MPSPRYADTVSLVYLAKTRIGLAYFVIGCVFLAGPPSQGALVSGSGDYWQAAVLAGTSVLCGFVCNVVTIWLTRRKKKTWKV